MVSCGGCLVKYILLLFNLILLAAGCFVIYSGNIILQENNNSSDWSSIFQTNFKTGSIVLIIFGALIALIALIGVLGTCFEIAAFLDVYSYIIFFLVIGEVVLFYYSFRFKDDLVYNMEVGMKNAINQYDNDAELAYGLQKIQKFFECCGFESPNDYKGNQVPASCCNQMSKVSFSNSRASCSRNEIVYEEGCKYAPFLKNKLGNLTHVAYALIFIQLIVILAACCLSRDLRTRA